MRACVVPLLALVACHDPAWESADAPKTPPDEQFRTGVEVGYDAWIWYCYEGQRVVVTQGGSAYFGASQPKTDRGPCGAPLDVESTFPPARSRHEVPPGSRWPGT